jgi:hypothetical protein
MMEETTLEGKQPEVTSAAPTKGTQKVEEQISALEQKLRQMQAIKDKEVATARREAEEAKQRITALSQQLESVISDPAAKQEFKTKRLEAEVEAYRAKEGINQHRQLLVREYGVPASELETIDDPALMTDAALRFWRKQSEAKAPDKTERVAELEKLQESGAHDVSIAPAPTPGASSATLTDIEKRINALKDTARKGRGHEATQARMEILSLKAQQKTPPTGRSRM